MSSTRQQYSQSRSKNAKATSCWKPKRTNSPPKKYKKYWGKPRDVQHLIAYFGPEYDRDNLARLIYQVARSMPGTGFTNPSPKDSWYAVLLKAIGTGNSTELLRASETARRAHQALKQPFDPVAIQILDQLNAHGYSQSGNQRDTLPMTIREFVNGYFPKTASKSSMRRRVRMVSEALEVYFKPW